MRWSSSWWLERWPRAASAHGFGAPIQASRTTSSTRQQATALASSGVEAEMLAKAALLSGPELGLAVLEPAGGVLVLDDGEVVRAGKLREVAAEAA